LRLQIARHFPGARGEVWIVDLLGNFDEALHCPVHIARRLRFARRQPGGARLQRRDARARKLGLYVDFLVCFR
jgi:hypothetical protein